MSDKKNIILAFGNKEFNNSLLEIKDYFDFDLEIKEEYSNELDLKKYNGLIIHENALNNKILKKFISDDKLNKIIMCNTNNNNFSNDVDKLILPASIEQINKAILDSLAKKKFKSNSSLQIHNYILDKNERKLTKEKLSLDLTEKEIDLIELLYNKSFIKKKEILSIIWKYSDDADTHTVETHIYRLRKKIKKVFDDDLFIKNNKKGYNI